ncbi:MAG: citrate transporter [Ruminococcus sp.]|nr:citrate transporter [Ruminococcus sp.]
MGDESLEKLKNFVKAQPVLVIAFFAALVTVFIVPPDSGYGGYINRSVLIQLFCLMTAIGGFRSVGIFENLTAILLKKAGNIRRLGIIFTIVCFFTSMLVTNDVALITFVPLTLMVFEKIRDEKSRILTIVLETAAANLGSMVTPFGNPQNLFIYDKYSLTLGDFFSTMLPSAAVSLALLLLMCFLLPKSVCRAERSAAQPISNGKTAIYAVLFILCLLTVFRVVPDWVCLIIAVVTALATDRQLLFKVDYGLLATFVCFFVFVGNIARIEAVRDLVSVILKERELIVSVALSQIISNVPAAVMLSGFTDNGRELLLGVNLGGLGTIIASLASLISFQYYKVSEGAKSLRYMVVFTVVNFALLAVLLVFTAITHSLG